MLYLYDRILQIGHDRVSVTCLLIMLVPIFVTFVALFLPILAVPTQSERALADAIVVPRINPLKFLCGFLPLPSRLCPSQGSYLDRVTPLGIARGVSDPLGAFRFAVRYGKAPRWQPSSVVTSWELPCVHLRLQLRLLLILI